MDSKLPFGPPPLMPTIDTLLKSFLSNPGSLNIHDHKRLQKIWPCDKNVQDLFSVDFGACNTNLKAKRDLLTGDLLDFEEVIALESEMTSRNSSSLHRTPCPSKDSVRGSTLNFPFWPGGMAYSEVGKVLGDSISAIDFETNLLQTAPGLSRGVNFNDSSVSSPLSDSLYGHKQAENVDFIDIKNLYQFEELDVLSHPIKEEKTKDKLEADLPKDRVEEFQIVNNVLNISQAKPLTGPTCTEWAEILDVTKDVEDFEQRVPVMAFNYKFELDNFQKQAVICLEERKSVLVAAHTSAGKTAVAEYAIALCQKHLSRCIYTSPIKALSNQKFRDFKTVFEDVGLLTGDVQIKTDASCLIMTTEILRSMLYNGSDVIRDVEWVVFDEVHYISDPDRGVVWEEVIIMLPDHVNVILLSATVPNTLDFAHWIGSVKSKKIHVVCTHKRPVPLEHFLYTGTGGKTKDDVFLLVDKEKNFLTSGYKKALESKATPTKKSTDKKGHVKVPFQKRGLSPQMEKNMWIGLLDHLKRKDKLPVVAFVFSRNRCDYNAAMLGSVDFNTQAEKSRIHAFINSKCLQRLKGSDRKLPQVHQMTELLKRGIAVHHSGILPLLKEVVELLFADGYVKLLFATETFAMGINMPARTVVFDSIRKHDGYGMRDLLPSEYIQMAGRAGRRGLDSTGTVLMLCKTDIPESSTLHNLTLGIPTKLESKFRLTYSMILNLLRVQQLRVEDVMSRSFCEIGVRRAFSKTKETIRKLKDSQTSIEGTLDASLSPACRTYCETCHSYFSKKERVMKCFASMSVSNKILSPGRVLVLNSENCQSGIGVLLTSNKGKYSVLLLYEEVDSRLSVTNLTYLPDNVDSHIKVLSSYLAMSRKTVELDSGRMHHTVVTVDLGDVDIITNKVIKVDGDKIFNDWSRQQMSRTRHDDSPSQGYLNALQSLREIVSSQSDLEPVDVGRNTGIEFTESQWELKQIRALVNAYSCCDHPYFIEEMIKVYQHIIITEEIKKSNFLLSEESLQFLPEYKNRLEVLRKLGYIDRNSSVQLKGRIACQIGNHELIVTEMVLENILTDLPPPEIAALLSGMVFQQTNCQEPNIPEHIKQSIEKVKQVTTRIAETQLDCGLSVPVEDYLSQLNFGLVEVVYEWAKGLSFSKITELTDVQEGIIVRCIQRLDESIKDVKDAARVIGDPVLYQKMEEVSTCIKRDIVFAASLYTVD